MLESREVMSGFDHSNQRTLKDSRYITYIHNMLPKKECYECGGGTRIDEWEGIPECVVGGVVEDVRGESPRFGRDVRGGVTFVRRRHLDCAEEALNRVYTISNTISI